ncbi:pentatricopeptide repeat-containing protein At1g09220, mitochondrial [Amaranthus tricolor]|uniref:pentatricopeptide repeat-containing protein At1g09220, mitochondrial n=1 Tax=Amaranthus tricolor TaxID=29722 RepID=UPI00258A4A1F|nr:pentatricopeptide repeat-containing protein At1g09220, mitochondrial [Amaranthus tricolor]
MRWLQRHCFNCSSQISLFSKFIASFSSYNHSFENHNHNQFLSLLNNFPSSRIITKQIHSQLTTNGLLNNLSKSHIIFLFNTLLRCYTIGEFPLEAFSLYKQAQNSTTLCSYFDSFTYSFLIKSCANLSNQFMGFQFHGLVVKLGFESHVYVQTSLLNIYIDFGLLSDAYKVFDGMPERNLVTWNVMITGLVKWGHLEAALALFREMPRKNIVSWTGMINGFTRTKDYVGALSLFQEMMIVGGIMPTEVTLLALSTAISELGDLKTCQSIHAFGEKCGYSSNGGQFTNCLIDTYAKCGCISSALKIFEMFASRRNVVSWTSIITGFAMHGMAKEAGEFLERMENSGISPNRVTFLSVLSAYSHGGLVEEGLQLFRKIMDCGFIELDVKHYGSVIDMLGRAGKLKEAEEIACRIPNKISNVIIWRTLLGACNFHGDIEIAERVSSKIQEMEREYGGDYVLMSNILTGREKFDEAENIRALMDRLQVLKSPGHSSV